MTGYLSTMKPHRPLVAGNWKMNGLRSSVGELQKIIAGAKALPKVELMVCPPATLVAQFAAAAAGSGVAIGGQDCHAQKSGAFTGDISAEMFKDAGAVAVIVGHSERRQYHGETDATVRAKAAAAQRAGLLPIICVGETREQRQAGETSAVVAGQVDGSVPDIVDFAVAYEPVWAIGSGETPQPKDVADVHRLIRDRLRVRHGEEADRVRILYGGSVTPANARELLAVDNVDGALVGGASLKADDFLAIAAVYR
jgi:triosephosphate isomerase (TIM)